MVYQDNLMCKQRVATNYESIIISGSTVAMQLSATEIPAVVGTFQPDSPCSDGINTMELAPLEEPLNT